MVAKQVADFITATRGLLVFIFPSIGVLFGEEALPWAAAFLATNWTGGQHRWSIGQTQQPSIPVLGRGSRSRD